MATLNHILESHPPLLVLDAASQRVQVGWLAGGVPRWRASLDEAGIGLFEAVEALGVDLGAVRSFAFCEGPGSILGIRTAAVAIRTWCALEKRPVFAYQSLGLAAAAHGRPGAAYIADARRNAWHWLKAGEPLRRMPAAELSGPVFMPEGFLSWTPTPAGLERVSYDLAELMPKVAGLDLFRQVAEPDALLSAEPVYATWTPRMHGSP